MFICKLDASGALIYSSYLGGSMFDYAYDVAVDTSGCAYVAGKAWSTDFPTVNAFQPTNKLSSGYNFTVTKVAPAALCWFIPRIWAEREVATTIRAWPSRRRESPVSRGATTQRIIRSRPTPNKWSMPGLRPAVGMPWSACFPPTGRR